MVLLWGRVDCRQLTGYVLWQLAKTRLHLDSLADDREENLSAHNVLRFYNAKAAFTGGILLFVIAIQSIYVSFAILCS